MKSRCIKSRVCVGTRCLCDVHILFFCLHDFVAQEMVCAVCLSSQHIRTHHPAHSTQADFSTNSHYYTGDTESELLIDSDVNQIEPVSVCLSVCLWHSVINCIRRSHLPSAHLSLRHWSISSGKKERNGDYFSKISTSATQTALRQRHIVYSAMIVVVAVAVLAGAAEAAAV